MVTVMAEVGIALGSNLGDSRGLLIQAARRLALRSDVTLVAASKIYRTSPWGVVDQPDFLNACLIVETTLEPYKLLDACQVVETALGRQRGIKWGPRKIDTDILWYDDLNLDTDRLIVPHPHMLDRDFVMVPLSDIAPERIFSDQSVAERAQMFSGENVKVDGTLVSGQELMDLQQSKASTIHCEEAELKGTIVSDQA